MNQGGLVLFSKKTPPARGACKSPLGDLGVSFM